MDLACTHYHSNHGDLDWIPPSTRCFLNVQLRWNQRNCVKYYMFSSLKGLRSSTSSEVKNARKKPLYSTKPRTSPSYDSKKVIIAQTETSENFYGDDDDTILDSDHEENSGFVKFSNTSRAESEKKTSHSSTRSLKWPLWLLGPSVLLTTGVIPTLWLPFVPLFEGSSTAGLLALAGLDGAFNLGASMFLLMADSCARSWGGFVKSIDHELPLGYKVWSCFVNMIGFLAPVLAFIASKRGFLEPQPALLPLSAMLAPYSVLLLVHMFAEVLVWQWRSPVWAVVPLVYDCYSVLQLCRGLQLGMALGAPQWLIEAVKGLISWWVFVLGVQLMWIAWFLGSRTEPLS